MSRLNVQDHIVGQLPSLYLIQDYINGDVEERLLREIHSGKARWEQVSGRRVRSLGGVVSDKTGGLIPAPMPSWLHSLVLQISTDVAVAYGGEQANHVLLNSYDAGGGILPHEDGPVYYPGVCVLSLGSSAVMRFRRKRCTNAAAGGRGPAAGAAAGAVVALEPRSLLVFMDDAYAECLHGIDQVAEEELGGSGRAVCHQQVDVECEVRAGLQREGARTSITVRRVLKVHRLGIKQ